MKRSRLWAAGVVLLAGVGVLTGAAGVADGAKATCSVATLRGMYLFEGGGLIIAGQDHIPFAAAGYEVYDGKGIMTSVGTYSLNGEITRQARLSGTYSVNPDCTGSATYPNPQDPNTKDTFDLFIAPDGDLFSVIQTNPGVVLVDSEQRVTSKRIRN